MNRVESASVSPVPPRYRWLKRVTIGAIVLTVVLGSVRWYWGVRATRVLQAEIDRYVVAGQPVYQQDFVGPPIPDEQNAAVPLGQALALIDAMPNRSSTRRVRMAVLHFSDSQSAGVPELLAETAQVRELTRLACQRPRVGWQNTEAGTFLSCMYLSDSLVLAAQAAHQKSDELEAFNLACDLAVLARYLGERYSEICMLVSWEAYSRATAIIEEALPNLHADPTSIEKAIRELADDSYARRAAVKSLYAMRADRLQTLEEIRQNPPIWWQQGWLNHQWGTAVFPMLQVSAVRALREHTAIATALSSRSEPEFLTRFPPAPPRPSSGLQAATQSFAETYTYPLTMKDMYRQLWAVLARRGMTATALAITLYERDHGKMPERLEDLVPAYLPSLPVDPFTPDQRLFIYNRQGPTPSLATVGRHRRLTPAFRLRPMPRKTDTPAGSETRTQQTP